MTKPTKKAVRRVKAFVVVDKKGNIRPHGEWYNILVIGYSPNNLDLHRPSDKIIPATITYSLPRLTKKK